MNEQQYYSYTAINEFGKQISNHYLVANNESENDIINLLMVDPEPDDFDPAYPELWRLWEHVILTGYDVILANITSDDFLERKAHYISKDGTETVVIGGDNIERCTRHPN